MYISDGLKDSWYDNRTLADFEYGLNDHGFFEPYTISGIVFKRRRKEKQMTGQRGRRSLQKKCYISFMYLFLI